MATQAQNPQSDIPPNPPPAGEISDSPEEWQMVDGHRQENPAPEGSTSDTTPKASDPNANQAKDEHPKQRITLIKADLKFIGDASKKVDAYGTDIKKQHDDANKALKEFEDYLKKMEEDKQTEKKQMDMYKEELSKLKKHVLMLKVQIPPKIQTHDPSETQQSTNYILRQLRIQKQNLKEPLLHNDPVFVKSDAYRALNELYNGLDIRTKLCLLCFSVFPDNATIKKRLLIYLWMAEGLIDPDKAVQEEGDTIFKELMTKGFIEAVNLKRSLEVDSCKMHPLVRSAVVMFAESARFLDVDAKGNPSEKFLDDDAKTGDPSDQNLPEKKPNSLRLCLVGQVMQDEPEKLQHLHMMFNVKETSLDFKPESLASMKNVNILYLGRWQSTAKHHIEVEETRFLEELHHMRYLKYLSLQGVSRITKLPDSLSKLSNLIILDIRACHSLEELPEHIGDLTKLRHLDMSECYLLDHIPKSLSQLKELLVLKGFVVGDSQGKQSCTVADLSNLTRLAKLTIYTGRTDFPTDGEVRNINKIKSLRRLAIAWGGASAAKQAAKPADKPDSNPREAKEMVKSGDKTTVQRTLTRRLSLLTRKSESDYSPVELPGELEKLDLKCFPRSRAPEWLKPSKLQKLKKLYIRGGRLRDVGRDHDWTKMGLLDSTLSGSTPWKVEILRLKYLDDMEMDWKEVQRWFPELVYLEKVKCPKLSLFPCDGFGVWMDKKEFENRQSDQAP